MPDANAAIVMLRGIVDESFGDGTRIMPKRAPGLRIEGECVVGGGDEHDSVHDYRRYFELAGVECVKDPLGAKLRDVTGIDFAESAVTAAGIVAIVREPVSRDGIREHLLWVHVDVGDDRSHPAVLSGQWGRG